MQFKPSGDFVLIEPIQKGFTPMGLAVPPSGDSLGVDRGRVVAVGPGGRTQTGVWIDQEYSPGEVIALMPKQPGLPLEINGKHYALVRAGHIVGRIVDEPED